jgi:hypothetical protein
MKMFSDHFWKAKYSVIIFLIKIVAGFSLSWIYTHHYTSRSEADVFRYYDDARLLNDVFYQDKVHFCQMIIGIEDKNDPVIQDYMKYSDGWRKQTQEYLSDRKLIDFNVFNDHHTITKINAVLLFFSFGSYPVHMLFFAFLALIGLRLINKVADHFVFEFSLVRHLLLYLFPSVLIWTSGATKEALLVFGIGLLLRHIQLFSKKYDLKHLLFALLACFVIIKSKYFILLLLIPVIPLLFQFKKTYRTFAVIGFSTGVAILLFSQNAKLFTKQHENKTIIKTYPNTTVVSPVKELNNDLINSLESIGQAITNTYFQPILLPAKSMMVTIAKAENVLLIILIILALSNFKVMRKDVFVLLLGTIILSSILIGFSTLIVGNIHRYKLTPLLIILIVVGQYFPYQYKVNLEHK